MNVSERMTAHFQGEAWINNYAVAVDDAEAEWDCTAEAHTERGAAYLATLTDDDDLGGVVDNDDWFAHDPAAPELVREWRGPFTIRIRHEPEDSCEGEPVPDEIAEQMCQDAYEAFHGEGPYAIDNA
jgi:hypothetical protein